MDISKQPIEIIEALRIEEEKSTYFWKAANHYKRQFEYTSHELNSWRAVLTAVLLGNGRGKITVKKKDLQKVIDRSKFISVTREDDPKTGDIIFTMTEVTDPESHNETENKKAILIK